jgi:hypothetical protein
MKYVGMCKTNINIIWYVMYIFAGPITFLRQVNMIACAQHKLQYQRDMF